jgi:hypothetical protein
MKFYSKKSVFCRNVDRVHACGISYRRSTWVQILKDLKERFQPGQSIFNDHTKKMDVVKEVEYEWRYIDGTRHWYICRFTIYTESDYCIYHKPFKSRKEWMRWWGFTEHYLKWVDLWNEGYVYQTYDPNVDLVELENEIKKKKEGENV